MKYKRTITKLFNDKYASIKDYEVEKAIELGGAEITLKANNKQMFLSVDQLKKALLTKTKQIKPPRFKGEPPFRLCNVFWKQKENTNQLELLNE